MNWMKLLFVLTFVVTSCATEDEKMQRYLVGNWETVFVKLEMPSYMNKDTIVEYDIDFANPDDPRAQTQGKPMTSFNLDGTFTTWAELNNRATGRKTSAKWRATKDSLFYDIMDSKTNKSFTVSFGLEKIEDGYATKRLVDQDRDGAIDDMIYIETVRLPNTKN